MRRKLGSSVINGEKLRREGQEGKMLEFYSGLPSTRLRQSVQAFVVENGFPVKNSRTENFKNDYNLLQMLHGRTLCH
jgi:hypothetical protein